ncbi:MAG: aminomethyl-transferring glycine dehydrogenase subunit GcvPA [Thermodesulfobacteriota bacterium]|nr:aminomethyl-transferring glycine dehydrogenase subunit GcvPA [Thermodesulfobacteriota bacterium]
MRYLPHTEEDIISMLQAVGMKDMNDLFSMIPGNCKMEGSLDLTEPLTEWELNTFMDELSKKIATSPAYRIFVGAGSYNHYIPESVSYLLGRSEFSTAYTPYQPEISQGTLQAIYEYQTLITRLLGMEVSNASMHDGASALAEAILMATRATKRKRVALSVLIHPHYRDVVRTYLEPGNYEIIELPRLENGKTDLSRVGGMDDLAAVVIQSPNFFGCIEDLRMTGDVAHKLGALFVLSFTEPLAYGLLKNPGSQGADIVCGEGQSLGIPQSFGGPGLGIFACRMKQVRDMPGRLVGKTIDMEGKSGFVLTLATREQHIRREKAKSNICTNNSLCALASAMYMASVGGTGIRELACLNYDKTEYLKRGLRAAGFGITFDNPTFNEFVVEFGNDFKNTYKKLLERGIIAGIPLDTWYPDLSGHYLLCVTETMGKSDMDDLIKEAR